MTIFLVKRKAKVAGDNHLQL